MKRAAWWGAIVAILLVAAFLRFFRLDVAPPGMPIDEIVDGSAVQAVASGWRPIFIPQGWGREPLYHYLAAPLLLIVRDPQMTIRLTSALVGLAFVVAIGLFTAKIADWRAGFIAAAFAAVSYWAVFASRYGVRNITLPLMSTLTAISFFRADKSSVKFALAGILLGLTFYTYQSSRLLPFLFVLIVVWLWLFERKRLGETWRGLLLFFATGLIIGAPLFIYLLTHPGAESGRAFMLEPLDALCGGDPVPLLSSLWATLRFLFVDAGDWTYNVPGQPVFPLGAGLLFCVGVIACLVRWRNVQRITLPLWLVIGLLPSMVTSGPHYMRLIGALPPAMALLGIGTVELCDWLTRRVFRSRAQASAIILLIVGVLALGQTLWATWHNYFETWAVSPHVRAEHDSNLREIGRYLDRSAETTPVVIASVAAEDVEPDRFGAMLGRTDLDQRWFDASNAIVFPGNVLTARYFFRPETPLRVVLADHFAGAQLVAEQRWYDGPPAFNVYQLDVPRAREATEIRAAWPLGKINATPLRFGDKVELLGYAVPLTITLGNPVRLLTTWRVVNSPTPGPSGIFAHLLDGDGRIVAQDDRLGFPRHSWHAGDLFVQFSRLEIPSSLLAGRYTLQIGFYDKDTQARWPATDAVGKTVGDHLVLGEIAISDQ